MKAKKVDGWQTTDEKFFTSHSEAAEHQDSLNREAKIRKWVLTNCWSGMSTSDIVRKLVECGDELKPNLIRKDLNKKSSCL